ncbi:MAG TPA: 5-(carboxyamino)imidazole ribonucleotide synthase [Gemmatimonadaceae bacterium]|nr:5-(carboxyamino)imidazole ribonucleotide synthase [Gemmatimonadaceae bacterium]
MTVILPGATIGLLGGGQLGRMTGYAARSLGYDVHVLDPDPACPARAIASRTITAPFTDAAAAADLARGTSVVTLEIEQIGADALAAVSAIVPLRPSAAAVVIVQDRLRQRQWLDANGFPLGAWCAVSSPAEAQAAVEAMGKTVLKKPVGGYDGRGQARVRRAEDAAAAWESLGSGPVLAEQFLDLALELSVLVARRDDGVMATYAPAINHHEAGVLDWSVWPGDLHPKDSREAKRVAEGIATRLGIVGLLAVEMFRVRDGRLLVNELAPRPHNSYHHSERGASTSQFEQFVRAVCGLPLGSVDVLKPAAISNLLGDLWEGGTPDFESALTIPDVRLHLYGKTSARPGRKMGHLSAVGDTVEEAREKVLTARSRLAST